MFLQLGAAHDLLTCESWFSSGFGYSTVAKIAKSRF